MLEERLSKVDLTIDVEDSEQFRNSIILTTKRLGDQDTEISEDEYDYRQKIKLFVEMEKLKLISLAMQAGIPEADVDKLLSEENVPDYDLDNLKTRLGIEVVKKKRSKKVVVEENKDE